MRNQEAAQLKPGETVYNNRYGRMRVEEVLNAFGTWEVFGVKVAPTSAIGRIQLEVDSGVANTPVLLVPHDIHHTPDFWQWFRDYRRIVEASNSLPCESPWPIRPDHDIYLCFLVGFSVRDSFEIFYCDDEE